MTNLFEPAVVHEIISRLEKLQPSAKANWGKMNVAQMLAHCQAPFEVYFGDRKSQRELMGILFGRIARRKLFTDKPWPRSLPTAKDFVIVEQRNFDKEKDQLVNLINRFATKGDTGTITIHPFFGKMTSQDWARLFYKHLDHHLQQFGV